MYIYVCVCVCVIIHVPTKDRDIAPQGKGHKKTNGNSEPEAVKQK